MIMNDNNFNKALRNTYSFLSQEVSVDIIEGVTHVKTTVLENLKGSSQLVSQSATGSIVLNFDTRFKRAYENFSADELLRKKSSCTSYGVKFIPELNIFDPKAKRLYTTMELEPFFEIIVIETPKVNVLGILQDNYCVPLALCIGLMPVVLNQNSK